MSAKNIYHNAVVRALIADGWTITDDPLTLKYGERELFVDLGAEQQALAAEKNGRKIAVEVQSFLSASPIHDLEVAIGQYIVFERSWPKSLPNSCSTLPFRSAFATVYYPNHLANW